MADYIYLLENRLSAAQQAALQVVRTVSRAHGLTVFLVGGAVRDLTSGSPVRDLDVAVQGNALELKKDFEAAGGVVTGESSAWRSLFVRFEGGVRIEVGSTLSVTYPKPGKPTVTPATILDDLRRRDFTANAMALSLNDGSYGLLMDPLNGVADIENRQLRLVSNYGFIEDPSRMVRAARFAARLGWMMDEKTQSRYETGKQEEYISVLDGFHRGYETEEIFHEEDPLRILRKLEGEGWMKHLFPALTVAKANAVELDKLREVQTQLQMRGIHPEAASANFPLLTAKLSAKEISELKASFVRPGFVSEIEALEADAKEVATLLTGKGAASPSQAWKLLIAAKPEAVLWVAYSSKSGVIQGKLKSFFTEWPQARNKIPYTLMQEMRIVPELAGFDEIVEKLFYELMDGRLGTVEEMKAFLEVYSPPAPPPPVHLRRARAAKKDAKGAKGRKKAVVVADSDDDEDEDRDGHDDEDEDDDDDHPSKSPKADPDDDLDEDEDEGEEGDRSAKAPAAKEQQPAVKTVVAPKAAEAKPVEVAAVPAPAKAVPAKSAVVKHAAPMPSKSASAAGAVVSAKTTVKPTAPTPVTKKAAVPAAKVSAGTHKGAAPAGKTAAKPANKAPAVKAAPAKAVPAKGAKGHAPARAQVPAKKAAPLKSAPAAKKTVPAKKSVPVKGQAAAKPAAKHVPAKKASAKKTGAKRR